MTSKVEDVIDYSQFGGCYIESNIIESTFKIRKMSILQFRIAHMIINSILVLSISINNLKEEIIWNIIEGKQINNY